MTSLTVNLRLTISFNSESAGPVTCDACQWRDEPAEILFLPRPRPLISRVGTVVVPTSSKWHCCFQNSVNHRQQLPHNFYRLFFCIAICNLIWREVNGWRPVVEDWTGSQKTDLSNWKDRPSKVYLCTLRCSSESGMLEIFCLSRRPFQAKCTSSLPVHVIRGK